MLAAIGLEEPIPPLQEDFDNPEDYQIANDMFTANYQDFVTARDEELSVRLDSGEIPPGVTGLIPDGSTKVSWRWMG